MPDPAVPCEFRFECTRCSSCCTGGPGFVWLSEADARALADYLGKSVETLLADYCTDVDIGLGKAPSLRERSDYSCIFLGPEGCEVYPARPAQCRTYPFWDSILSARDGWRDEGAWCPGIGKGEPVDPQRIADALAERRRNPPMIRQRDSAEGGR